MSNPLAFNCPKCSAEIVTPYDRDKDNEIICPHCKAVIVLPRNGGEPFVEFLT
jgi:DNA-directed RNA polymerase subunit RPC12/RpoP